jgi:hypothetical protein
MGRAGVRRARAEAQTTEFASMPQMVAGRFDGCEGLSLTSLRATLLEVDLPPSESSGTAGTHKFNRPTTKETKRSIIVTTVSDVDVSEIDARRR